LSDANNLPEAIDTSDSETESIGSVIEEWPIRIFCYIKLCTFMMFICILHWFSWIIFVYIRSLRFGHIKLV
jgi:hypothetical protein